MALCLVPNPQRLPPPVTVSTPFLNLRSSRTPAALKPNQPGTPTPPPPHPVTVSTPPPVCSRGGVEDYPLLGLGHYSAGGQESLLGRCLTVA